MHEIAVAVPVFNGASTLEKALQNLADQDFENLHIYIFENKSTDDSLQIAKSFCRKDSRFEIVESAQHLNALQNFLRAIRYASSRSRYFSLRACDDTSSLNYFSKLYDALEASPQSLLAGGDAIRIKEPYQKRIIPNNNIFGFKSDASIKTIPRNLNFPSEWFYGLYRSEGAAEILERRLPELGGQWALASYTIAEFVIRGLVSYVPDTHYNIFAGSDSVSLYFQTRYLTRLDQRWRYAIGCFNTRRFLPAMNWLTLARFFAMCWNDSRRKTRYKLIGFQRPPEVRFAD